MLFEDRFFEESSLDDSNEMKMKNGKCGGGGGSLHPNNNNNNNAHSCLKHALRPTDTLQGLALQYGVTMEQIKRANKMWTADSLFLRSSLDIPLGRESGLVVSPLSPPTSPHHLQPQVNGGGGECTTSIDLGQLEQQDENGVEESAADFLIRIDSHIAQTKDKVLRLQSKVVYSEDDLHNSRDGGFSHRHYHRSGSLNGSSSLSDLYLDPSTATATAVVMTKGRKVKSSLKRLERQQDEIFEL